MDGTVDFRTAPYRSLDLSMSLLPICYIVMTLKDDEVHQTSEEKCEDLK